MPSLPLANPVSGRSSTVYGMFIGQLKMQECTHATMRIRISAFVHSCILAFLHSCIPAFSHAFSGSNCGVKSFVEPGTLYSYGPRYAIGSVRKLPCPGGDGADHSSVVASHGFLSTTLPHLMLERKLMMNGSWNSPSVQAAIPITTFHFSSDALCAYCMPPSYIRRFMPPRPWINIGKNTMLMQMNEPQKWILPSSSFILRPVAFGNQ